MGSVLVPRGLSFAAGALFGGFCARKTASLLVPQIWKGFLPLSADFVHRPRSSGSGATSWKRRCLQARSLCESIWTRLPWRSSMDMSKGICS